jgi:hypothetical protein
MHGDLRYWINRYRKNIDRVHPEDMPSRSKHHATGLRNSRPGIGQWPIEYYLRLPAFLAVFLGAAFFAAFFVTGLAATALAAFLTAFGLLDDLVVFAVFTAEVDAFEEPLLPPNAESQPAAYLSLVPTRVMVTGLPLNPIEETWNNGCERRFTNVTGALLTDKKKIGQGTFFRIPDSVGDSVGND